MRPKTVEENIVNFNAVADDAIARFVTLKEGCRPDDHIPNLEGELSRFSTESKFYKTLQIFRVSSDTLAQPIKIIFICYWPTVEHMLPVNPAGCASGH